MNSCFIKSCLEGKYKEKSIVLPEVKTGSSNSRFGVIDFIAIEKTWSPITIKGFEIKVSRQDFLRDQKWRKYLDYCNEFYFICPKGLIKPNELPPEAGLMYVYPSGYVITKKKAPRTELVHEKVMKMLLYILFWRSSDASNLAPQKTRADLVADYLDGKIKNKYLGYQFQTKLVAEVVSTTDECEKLREQVRELEKSKEFEIEMKSELRKYGVRCHRGYNGRNSEIISDTIKLIRSGGLSASGKTVLKRISQELSGICARFDSEEE